MRYLAGNDEQQALEHIARATEVARLASCERSKCGSVIVKDQQIIGRGYNSPPAQDETQRKCHCDKNSYDRKVTDKTCCVHAEQRAIMDALRNHPTLLPGATLYFIRLDEQNQPSHAGEPYCTICSKMALDTGITEFVLWHKTGVCVYDTQEYNLLSYQFKEKA